MKVNQKGFSLVEIVVVIAVVGLLGAVGWIVYERQKSKAGIQGTTAQTNQQGQKQKAYEGWKSGTFKYTKLSYKLPPNWKDISDNTVFQDGNYKYEEIELKAADGFVLSMSVNNLPRVLYKGALNNVVLEFKDIDNAKQWIITDNANGKVSKIYVGSGVKKVGDKILPVVNVGRDGLNIELIGLYDKELGSLAEFNEKQSVKEAKLVFESLRF